MNSSPLNSTVQKLSTLERKLNIEVPAAEVQAAFDKAFRDIQRLATFKGFRKGKVPLVAVRSMYGEKVQDDVFQALIKSNYMRALNEHDLHPIGYPTIEFDHPEAAKAFVFTAEFEIEPEVPSVRFENLSVKKEKFVLDPARVEAIIDDVRRSRAKSVPILEDRAARFGDTATIDFEGSLLTGPFPGGSAQSHEVELGSKSLIAGFEEGLEGMRIGSEKTLNLAFPDDYHEPAFAGKPVSFKIKLLALKKNDVPELTDAVVREMGPYDSVQALREAIQNDIKARETNRIDNEFRERLLRALADSNPIEIPKTLAIEQKKLLLKNVEQRLSKSGLSTDAIADYKSKWDADLGETAIFMVQTSLLVNAIAIEQKLLANGREVETRLRNFARDEGIDFELLKKYYKSHGDKQSLLIYQITEQKVVDFLLNKVAIVEVSADALLPASQ